MCVKYMKCNGKGENDQKDRTNDPKTRIQSIQI